MTIDSLAFDACKTVTECLQLRDRLFNEGEIGEIKASIVLAELDQKKLLGTKLKELRLHVQDLCDARIQVIQTENEKDTYSTFDPTFYADTYTHGRRGVMHPTTIAIQEIVEVFDKMGFDVFQGKQILDQWTNFTSVNTPDHHPARDMQDTFFLDVLDKDGSNFVMKTQATSNFSDYAKSHQPPFRVVFPSITFRNETMDATHDVNFFQFDMWMVEKNMSVSQLITLQNYFFREYFGSDDIQVRLRPSYFPFVQPGFETDIYVPWFKGGRWVEVAGSGLIERNVLEMAGFDSSIWSGIAWGMGIERLFMIKHGLSGVTQFYNGDLSFIRGQEK